MDLILKLVCIALSFGMLALAYAVSRTGSWLMPASIYCIAWFLFTVIPLVALLTVPANPLAIGYILLTCIAFSLPALFSRWRKEDTLTGEATSSVFDSVFLRTSFYAFTVLSIVATAINTLAQGISLQSLLTDFFAISNSLIADRYSENTVESIFAPIANVASYTAVALGGLVFPGYRTQSRRMIVLVAALLPSIVVMVLFGAKGMIFLCIAMFYAGTLVRRLRAGDHRLTDKRTLLRGLVGTLALLPLITISFIARGLYAGSGVNTDVVDGLVRYFVSYTSAHIYAFSDWFTWQTGGFSDQYYSVEQTTYGFYSFMSIFRLMGDNRLLPPGVYDEYYQYGYYVQTNIYTIFRGLITDFTLVGSLVVVALFGVIADQIFIRMSRSNKAVFSIAYYIAFAGFVYTSFIISLLIWNSIFVMFALLIVVLFINNILALQPAARAPVSLGRS